MVNISLSSRHIHHYLHSDLVSIHKTQKQDYKTTNFLTRKEKEKAIQRELGRVGFVIVQIYTSDCVH
jgi:hypothetical protein